MINKNNKLKHFIIINLCFLLMNINNKNSFFNLIFGNKKKNIAIIGYPNDNNIGNQLLKYAMNCVLERFGFNPTLISIKEKKKVNKNYNSFFY